MFAKCPLATPVKLIVFIAWTTACLPLFIQKALLEIQRLQKTGEMDPSVDPEELHERMALGILDQLKDAHTGIIQALDSCTNGTNRFKIDHNWKDPTKGLARKNRRFS